MKLTTTLILILVFHTVAFATGIDGTYNSKCLPHAENRFFKSEAIIKEQSFSGKFSLFEDHLCQKLLLIVDYKSEVNYPAALEIGPIDHKVKSALMLVFSPEVRNRLNSEGFCLGQEIVIGRPFNIEGKLGCGPLRVPQSGSILFDMYEKKAGEVSFGAFPLMWILEEEKRPALTSRIAHRLK
jgi:hypothetical protein